MKRRNFLGLLGGAAVAGPQAAKAGVESLSLGGVVSNYMPTTGYEAGTLAQSPQSEADYYKSRLKRILGRSAEQIDFDRRSYPVHTLDPDIASIRSISLRAKIQMTRNVEYERHQRREKTWLEGCIEGLFNG